MIWLAAAVAALTFCIHTFVGGPIVARPLLAAENLPKASKWLSYFCWHIATVLLAAITFALLWLASTPMGAVQPPALAFFGLLSAALSILSAAVALKGAIHPLKFPSTTLFAVLSTICFMALSGI